jgi:hypothetical protein
MRSQVRARPSPAGCADGGLLLANSPYVTDLTYWSMLPRTIPLLRRRVLWHR